MLNSIKSFFESKLAHTEEDNTTSVKQIDLASAALLIEVMNSDHELDERESKEFLKVLQESLDVSAEDLGELVQLAESEAHRATSLGRFLS